MNFPKELKEAISNLSSVEKDKLIFRLLRKDIRFASRLLFELVSEDSQDDRREILENEMRENFGRISATSNLVIVLEKTREFSGKITELIFVTKDKFGEVYLNILLVNLTLEKLTHRELRYNDRNFHKLVIYLVNKIYKILELTLKLDEDLWLDLRDEFSKCADLLSLNSQISKICINNQLSYNWLKDMDIPENISEIKKNLRANGFLR